MHLPSTKLILFAAPFSGIISWIAQGGLKYRGIDTSPELLTLIFVGTMILFLLSYIADDLHRIAKAMTPTPEQTPAVTGSDEEEPDISIHDRVHAVMRDGQHHIPGAERSTNLTTAPPPS